MFVPHRIHAYGPPGAVTGIALLFNGTYSSGENNIFSKEEKKTFPI
jgi:hypothetical protein